MTTVDVTDVPVRCQGLVRIYRAATGETHALRGVDAQFQAGRFTGVLGPSGSGKSSLLALLALRDRPDGGTLQVLGTSTTEARSSRLRALRRSSIAWIAQRPTHSLFPHLSAVEHLRLAARLRRSPLDPVEALTKVGLAHRADSVPVQLSGGEQQRLAVACALAVRPPVVLADEPTAELDDDSAGLVLDALSEAAQRGSCVVVTTHDARLVAGADRVLLLRHGVLSTDRAAGGGDRAVIDSAGRLQLPQAALDLLSGGRAVVSVHDDHVRLDPLQDT